jgi:uncharacterized membrane protein YfcA
MALDLTHILVGVALLLAAFVKGATGLGFPLIATPMVALLLDIRIAVTILILPNLLMDITQVFRDGFPYAILQRFKSMIGLTIIGVFIGTMVLVMLPLWALNLSLGIMVLVFVTSNLLKFNFTISAGAEKFLSPLFGLVSGFLNGMTNAAGPTLAIYFYSLKLAKRDFVKSVATIFMITKATQLIAVSTWNLFNWNTLTLSLQVVFFTMVGFFAGLKTQDRVNQRTFSRGLMVLLSLVGVILIARALSQALK